VILPCLSFHILADLYDRTQVMENAMPWNWIYFFFLMPIAVELGVLNQSKSKQGYHELFLGIIIGYFIINMDYWSTWNWVNFLNIEMSQILGLIGVIIKIFQKNFQNKENWMTRSSMIQVHYLSNSSLHIQRSSHLALNKLFSEFFNYCMKVSLKWFHFSCIYI